MSVATGSVRMGGDRSPRALGNRNVVRHRKDGASGSLGRTGTGFGVLNGQAIARIDRRGPRRPEDRDRDAAYLDVRRLR